MLKLTAPNPPALRLEGFKDRPPWWGGDLQTLRNHFAATDPALQSDVEALSFPASDGSGDVLTGQLHLPWAQREPSPLVVLIHGLTGCERSTYVMESARFHLTRQRPVLRLNLRGAGPSRRCCGGYYHAGSFADLEDVLRVLEADRRWPSIVAIGFSLGGNILLNLLGRKSSAVNLLAAATVSAPIQPLDACRRLMHLRNAPYHRWLLGRMKKDVLTSAALSDGERHRIKTARSVYEFDDRWVAPRNGFSDALDYYSRTAGSRYVPAIQTPTLMIHAMNDPWIPVAPYFEVAKSAPPHVSVRIASGGGHVGFHERGQADTWHDRMIDRFIQTTSRNPGPSLS